jgi:hypothetical protein
VTPPNACGALTTARCPLARRLVARNSFTGTLPAEWSAMKAMAYMQPYENPLEGTLPAQWSAMLKMQEM